MKSMCIFLKEDYYLYSVSACMEGGETASVLGLGRYIFPIPWTFLLDFHPSFGLSIWFHSLEFTNSNKTILSSTMYFFFLYLFYHLF